MRCPQPRRTGDVRGVELLALSFSDGPDVSVERRRPGARRGPEPLPPTLHLAQPGLEIRSLILPVTVDDGCQDFELPFDPTCRPVWMRPFDVLGEPFELFPRSGHANGPDICRTPKKERTGSGSIKMSERPDSGSRGSVQVRCEGASGGEAGRRKGIGVCPKPAGGYGPGLPHVGPPKRPNPGSGRVSTMKASPKRTFLEAAERWGAHCTECRRCAGGPRGDCEVGERLWAAAAEARGRWLLRRARSAAVRIAVRSLVVSTTEHAPPSKGGTE
jgi:hypothetical protein